MLDKTSLVEIYRKSFRTRTAEEAIQRQLRAGKLYFAFYPATGQEMAPAVLTSLLEPQDQMVTIYRGIADLLARGLSVKEFVAECIGHSMGVCGGKGGGMGIARPDLGLMMTTGIVGSSGVIGAGLALANQLKKENRVIAVSMGDGATSIGSVHEAMMFASLWRLPLIFVIHNNAWAESTSFADYSVIEKLSDRAAGYNMPGFTVSGRDPDELNSVFAAAIARARAGEGPTFIESKTYRLCGHYAADACAYIDKAELEAEKANDPLPELRIRVLAAGATEAEVSAVEAAIKQEVDADIAEVIATPVGAATNADVTSDVYADPTFSPISLNRPKPDPIPEGPIVEVSMRDSYNHALHTAFEEDDRVFMLGEDIADPASGVVGISKGLTNRFGDRCRSTPIAEQGIFGSCVGAALAGMKPVGELLMMDFLPVAMDMMVNHAAKARYMTGGQMNVPMTMMTLVGTGNGAQHSHSSEAWLMHTPGLKVVYPSNPTDAKGLLLSCIDDPDPCVFIHAMSQLFQKGLMPEASYRIPLGLANVVREGTDVTIIAYGPTVSDAVAAADKLAGEGISSEIVDLRSLVPMDGLTLLESVSKTGRAIIAHRAIDFMGPAAEISAFLHRELFGKLKAPVARVAGAYAPVPKHAGLLAMHYKGVDAIIQNAKDMLK
jgi:pyruvate/2-oxoglutarate/acetoin dehydrogenase E1 component/TPP-dependent pyruvate/acetoin dehydrogenase alpha subunit